MTSVGRRRAARRDKEFNMKHNLPDEWEKWTTRTFSSYLVAICGGRYSDKAKELRGERRRRQNRVNAETLRIRGSYALAKVGDSIDIQVGVSQTPGDNEFDAEHQMPHRWMDWDRRTYVAYLKTIPTQLVSHVRRERRKRLQRSYVEKIRTKTRIARSLLDND